MSSLELSFACGETSLAVHRFTVKEELAGLFSLTILARSTNPAIDLEAIVGRDAKLSIDSGTALTRGKTARVWSGVVSSMEQVQGVQPAPGQATQKELSTYLVHIVPRLWLLTQRRNYRIFQHLTIPDIIKELLGEWGIEGKWVVDSSLYPKLEYKVQYGESDFAFFSRLIEDAGIAHSFRDEEGESRLLFSDCYDRGAMREGGALPFVDNPNKEAELEFVSGVRLVHEVRPETRTIADYDFRNPSFPLVGQVKHSDDANPLYEQYHYEPGSSLTVGHKETFTPAADDHGIARHDADFGQQRTQRRLFGGHVGKRLVSFTTNALDLWPGRIFAMGRHPHPDLTSETRLLVTQMSIAGSPNGEWFIEGHAVFTDIPFLPPHRTPKPRVQGVQSATVVGRKGQEIHTDEYGRVRVQFPWDRQYQYNERSSCWIRVSQGWAGTGYGMIVIPRVGQEVLVGFLEGDPDHPIIVGRVYNATHTPPYKLPEHKTRSTWKSDSSLGSNGFNEIMFEDKKGEELVWEQAQKNRRRLVKNDENITIGNNRQKLVKNDEDEQTLGFYTVYIGKDQDVIVKQNKRELVEGDSHLHVVGKRSQQINGKQSLTVKGDRHEVVAKNHALAVGEATHLAAGTAFVIEASRDLTLKGPGGFIRIDSGGVTICGTEVRINSGGSAGSGAGASPDAPEAPNMAVTDDVSKTLIGQ